MLYCRLIYMFSMLYVRLTIKVKVGISESFKVGWYPHKITGSSQLKETKSFFCLLVAWVPQVTSFLRTQRMRITSSVTYVGVRVFEFLQSSDNELCTLKVSRFKQADYLFVAQQELLCVVIEVKCKIYKQNFCIFAKKSVKLQYRIYSNKRPTSNQRPP